MRAAAWVPLLGAEVSLLFTLALARRWLRSGRPFLRSWSISLVCFTLGLAALWYGEAFGFTDPVFRTYYVAGALLAAPWLGLGEIELLVRPSVARWARDVLVLFSVVAGFVVGFDPLRRPLPGGHGVPDGAHLLAGLPVALVAASNVAGTVAVLGGIALSGWRSRGRGAQARSRFVGTLLIGAGVLVFATAGSAARAGVPSLQPALLTVGVTLMYAGFARTVRRPARHRALPAPSASAGPAAGPPPPAPAPAPAVAAEVGPAPARTSRPPHGPRREAALR